MRRLIYITFTLFSLCFTKAYAQDRFSIGAGVGPNFFFGSITRVDRIGLSTYLDTKYEFKEMFAVGLSHSYTTLNASRFKDINGEYRMAYHFDTKANAIDLHLQIDLIEAFNKKKQKEKYKVFFDFGAGYVFFDEMATIYSEVKNQLVPDYFHKDSHGKDGLLKVQFGGEASYEVSKDFEVFTSFMGHLCLNSDIDGYATYYDGTPAKKDFYYTLAFGGRYDLTLSETYKKKKTKKKRTKVLLQKTYRHERFSNGKNSQHRYHSKNTWFKKLFIKRY